MFKSIKTSEPIKRFEIDIKEDKINHYEPEEINDVFNDRYNGYKGKGGEYIEYKTKALKKHQWNNVLKALEHIRIK